MAAGAAGGVLGAGLAVLAAGRYAAGAALRTTRDGTGPVPAGFGGPALTVHAVTGEQSPGDITLTRSLASRLPGVYGLAGRRCHAVVGPVLPEASVAAGPGAVVRRLERTGPGGPPAARMRMRLTPAVHAGHPRGVPGAPGAECADVEVPGELGPLPTWFVPGERDTWVVAVHGLGTTREQPLNLLPFWRGLRLPVLLPAYRGDHGAPRPRDGFGHLGGSAWRDVDAVVRYAVRRGARRVVLHGWSTGAAMALHAAAAPAGGDGTSPEPVALGRVAGLVLDSPVLDPRATVRALAAARRVPRPLLPLVVRAAEGRARLRPDPSGAPPGPPEPRAPVLLVHGPGDVVAPWQASREFAERYPDLVALHPVEQAPHAAMWNADPEGYEERLRRFLTPLL